MVDVIIPAYNSQDTIIRTLSSIAMQLDRENIMVTIVNDGGEPYTDIIKIFEPILKIKEIGYKENKGPGYARQYGIDNTNNDYIIFIDADDTFLEACSVWLLTNAIKESNAKLVISPFVQIGKHCEQSVIPANLTWIFGHIYQRNFLTKHNIRFTPTRSNEDVGFNTMVYNIAFHYFGDNGGKLLTTPTYEWHYNEASITRRGKDEYEYGICTPGYIYNLHNAFDVCIREGVTLKEIAKAVLESLFSCFVYYNVALAKEVPAQTLWSIEELSRKFYYDYYNQVQDFISKDEYKEIYTQAYNSKGAHLQGIIPKMTLEGFIELMFSKEVNEKDYAQFEKEVQSVAEEERN
ncbi:MAG: glycosyltransferase family 2 protein [Bacilli bacterium]|nr:glycosyltransferase family 2 protein [Bacilli bacterium]